MRTANKMISMSICTIPIETPIVGSGSVVSVLLAMTPTCTKFTMMAATQKRACTMAT